MSRSLAQSYTHKVRFKEAFMTEPAGSTFCLFDDGQVFDEEIMAWRRPEPGIAMIVKNWKSFPNLVKATENPDYHKHDFKTVKVEMKKCECGEVES